jgi:hypothetical protein
MAVGDDGRTEFNKALSAEKLAQTTAYLADKYGVPLDPPEPALFGAN